MNPTKRLARSLHERLQAHFPAAFPRDYDALRPLKLGIEADILARLSEAGEPVDPDLLCRVLANHTNRAGYLLALLHGRGDLRYDLDGRPAGTVDAAARAAAATQLEALQQRQHARSARYQARKKREKEQQAAKAERLAERARRAEEKRRRREAHDRNRQRKLERLTLSPPAPSPASAPKPSPAVSDRKRRTLSLKGPTTDSQD